MSVLDAYNTRARLAPGLLTVLPVTLAGVALGLKEIPVVTTLFAIASACGLPVLLANTVGVRGRKLQSELARQWGGLPATQAVRHADGHSTGHQRQLWRERLQAVAGHTLPTAAEEAADPADADARFEAAIFDLLERTRDKQTHPLVFEENCTYGFERNLLAMRRPGLLTACITAATLVGAIVISLATSAPLGATSCLIALALVLTMAVVWWKVPSPDRVRVVAERYSDRLLGALTSFQTGTT